MSETQSQEKVTVAIASKVLKVDRRTIYRWMDKGLLSKVKEGNNTYVLMDDVRALRDKTMSHDKKADVAKNRGKGEAVNDTVTIERTHYEGLLTRLGQLEAKQELLLEYKGGLEAKDKELADTKESLNARSQELATVKNTLSTNAEELERARAAIIKTENELQRLLDVKRDTEAKIDSKDKEIEQARAALSKANSELKRLVEIRADAERNRDALEQRERELEDLRAEIERLKRPWWKRIFQKEKS